MKAIISRRIISIINAVFFTLLISFVVTTASLLLWLKQGIYFDHLTLFDHEISRLYIKWDKKVTFKVQSIEKLSHSTNKSLKIPNLDLILRIAYNALEKIEINYIKMDHFEGSIEYFDQQLLVKSNIFDLRTQYNINTSSISTQSLYLFFHDLKLTLEGNAHIEKDDNSLHLDAQYILANDLAGDIKLTYANDILALDAKTAEFSDINFLKKFFTISEKLSPWIFEKLQADTYEVQELKSHFSFDRPQEFLENLKISGEVTNFTYKFSPNLYPLKAPRATVHYKYGTLDVLPVKPTYNDKDIDGSKITLLYLITKPSIAIVLRNKGQLDKDIVDVLRNYSVPFPLIQRSGQSEMTADLVVDLNTLKTQYDATLNFTKSDLTLKGFDIFVDKSTVRIKDNILTITDTRLDDEGSLQGTIEGQVDVKEGLGKINVTIDSLDLLLVRTREPFTFNVLFNKDETILETQNSNWAFLNGYQFSLLNRQYILTKDLKLEIPSTHLYDPQRLDIFFSGFIDFKNTTYDMTLLLNNIIFSRDDNNNTMHLLHPVHFKSNSKTLGSFVSNRPLVISNGKENISIDQVSLVSDKKLRLKMDKIRYKDFFKTDINAYYDPKTKLGSFDFNNIQVDLNQSEPSYLKFNKEKLSFAIDNKNELRIYSPQLKSGYKRQNENHIFHIDDVAAITHLSPFLKSIHNKQGKIFIKTQNFKSFSLFSKLKNFEIDGFINNRIDKSIDIVGTIDKKGLYATVNEKVSLWLGKDINITLEDTGFDLQPLYKESNTTASEPFATPINVKGKNGFLVLGKKNQLIFDQFNAHKEKESFYATVKHGKGTAILLSEKKRLELFGENFNDRFIGNLIGFDGFKGGNYSFYVKEKNDLGTGGIHVEDATIKDFELYNNLLAYFNTIPALLTFNSPGFNAEGFTVNKGDIGFTKKADLITITSLKLFGRSSNIFGEGTIDLDKNTLDLTIRIFLLKDIGTILSNIPIAGYLLLGDDGSLTTTLTITGPLKDPEIGVNLAKDILMAPVNIIKRTFSLPSRILRWMTGDDEKQ